jgi:hypothetical protein
VTYSTWSTLEISLGCLKSVGMLATLITDIDLWRGDSMEGVDLRTFLGLEDCADMKIPT